MPANRIIILSKDLRPEAPIYASWMHQLEVPVDVLEAYTSDWSPPADTGLVVTAQHYEEPEVTIIRRCREAGIPVLIIADGIIEFRNTFCNPGAVPGAIYQPVLGDKIAVIGASQARTLETWGNIGRCEIVGSPRMDALRDVAPKERDRNAMHLVVTTARTPGFTPEQVELAVRGLRDLKSWIDAQNGILRGRTLRVTWRLTHDLDREVGVESQISSTAGKEAAALLRDADALITTPSTLILEGMLLGLPVATVDYTNSPRYVNTAWSISAASHIPSVVPMLAAPSEAHMHFQRTALHDALFLDEPATPRMLRLIRAMLEHAGRDDSTVLPDRILSAASGDPATVDADYDREAIYALQEERADAVERDQLRRYVAELEKRVKDQAPRSGGIGSWFRRG